MPELINTMDQYGEISDEVFDRLGIAKTADAINKSTDELVLNRRRSVILTHPIAIEKEIAYKKKRDDKVMGITTRNSKKTVAIIKTKTNFTLKLTNYKK